MALVVASLFVFREQCATKPISLLDIRRILISVKEAYTNECTKFEVFIVELGLTKGLVDLIIVVQRSDMKREIDHQPMKWKIVETFCEVRRRENAWKPRKDDFFALRCAIKILPPNPANTSYREFLVSKDRQS